MNLARSGSGVTLDLLLSRARSGELDLKVTPGQRQKTYEEIVAGLKHVETRDPEIPYQYYDLAELIHQGDRITAHRMVKSLAKFTQMTMKELATAFIRPACQHDHLDVLKYLVEDCKVDTNNTYLFSEIIKYNCFEHMKYLIEDCHADSPNIPRYALNTASECGHLELVKYLAKKYKFDPQDSEGQLDNKADVLTGALQRAAENGHFDVVRNLVESCGIDAKKGETAAAKSGHLKIVKYLAEKHKSSIRDIWELFLTSKNGHLNTVKCVLTKDTKPSDNEYTFLICAMNGHLEMVKYFVEEIKVDVNTRGHTGDSAIKRAITSNQYNVVKYLNEACGCPLPNNETLKKEVQDGYSTYLTNCEKWQRIAHDAPPDGLDQHDPVYFRQKAFSFVQPLLEKEKYKGRQANVMAFHAAGLFGTEDRVLQYLEKWGTAGKQPLHDLIYMIKLPAEKTAEMDLTAWADAVLKCGPSMAALVKFADKIPLPEKSSDGRTWSMVKTREKAAQFAYPRASENPALAALCMEHLVEENDFNKALKLNPVKIKNIPDITIDGKEFDLDGAKFYRLPANDVRGLFLGEMTDCCQSVGGAGEECAAHGFTSENAGFYVLENAKGKVVAQTWAWRGKKGELVFDSLETLGENVTGGQWKKLTIAFTKALEKNPGDVTAFHIGAGGDTPDSLLSVFNRASKPAIPAGYAGYRDSHKQVTVWKKPKS